VCNRDVDTPVGVEVVEMPARSLATLSSRPPASVALLGVISSLSASNHESLSRP